MQAKFIRLDDAEASTLVAGIEGRTLLGVGAKVSLVELGPGMHALVVDGVARKLGPHEATVLGGYAEDSAYCGPNAATVVDSFYPVREDHRELWEGSSAAGT